MFPGGAQKKQLLYLNIFKTIYMDIKLHLKVNAEFVDYPCGVGRSKNPKQTQS